MQRRLQAGLLVVLGVAVVWPDALARSTSVRKPGGEIFRAPFAVVELYTSEGCSSCPPADRLLSEILDVARRDGRRVFPLAFHVDSWDGLGWRDPWSDERHSRRQSLYAGAFESRYTPQMVVNGTTSFVGSDRERARQAVEAALAVPATVTISARAVPGAEAGGLRVAYEVAPSPSRHAVVHVALVERGLASQPTRGENRGRHLEHDNVVRDFATQELDAAGRGTVDLVGPAGLRRDRAAIVVYVQEAPGRRILGATGFDLPASSL